MNATVIDSQVPRRTGSLMTIRAMIAVKNGAKDVVNLKISRLGGLTKAKLMRDMCEALGIRMTIEDSWGGDVTTATIAHLAGSTRPEYLFSSTDFNSYVDVQVAHDAPKRRDGMLPVPTTPGLGITVNEKMLGQRVFSPEPANTCKISDLPPYAARVQEAVYLPIFDYISLINLVYTVVIEKGLTGSCKK